MFRKCVFDLKTSKNKLRNLTQLYTKIRNSLCEFRFALFDKRIRNSCLVETLQVKKVFPYVDISLLVEYSVRVCKGQRGTLTLLDSIRLYEEAATRGESPFFR